MNRQALTEHSGRKGREWRRAMELKNSELILNLREKRGG
jgi:hypothetical protein